jgi:protein TonB
LTAAPLPATPEYFHTPMTQRLHFAKFIAASISLHVLIIAVALYVLSQAQRAVPSTTPVSIVSLPREVIASLPPLRRPKSVPQDSKSIAPERPLPPEAVPMPKKFGDDDDVKLPKMSPRDGLPERAEKGGYTGSAAPQAQNKKGPLPFLSQRDIDELAHRGRPKDSGRDSVTLDTNEFKYISYNRWLKIKIESVLKYPELAARAGYQGNLYIEFTILKDGSLEGVEIMKSSGFKTLDDEAIRAIRSSEFFQPLPDSWNLDHYTIHAQVLFYLGGGYVR